RELIVGRVRTSEPGPAHVVKIALVCHRFVIVNEWTTRACVNTDGAGHAHSLDRLEPIRNFLRQPIVSSDDGDAEKIDNALRMQLYRHHSGLTVVADRRVV